MSNIRDTGNIPQYIVSDDIPDEILSDEATFKRRHYVMGVDPANDKDTEVTFTKFPTATVQLGEFTEHWMSRLTPKPVWPNTPVNEPWWKEEKRRMSDERFRREYLNDLTNLTNNSINQTEMKEFTITRQQLRTLWEASGCSTWQKEINEIATKRLGVFGDNLIVTEDEVASAFERATDSDQIGALKKLFPDFKKSDEVCQQLDKEATLAVNEHLIEISKIMFGHPYAIQLNQHKGEVGLVIHPKCMVEARELRDPVEPSISAGTKLIFKRR